MSRVWRVDLYGTWCSWFLSAHRTRWASSEVVRRFRSRSPVGASSCLSVRVHGAQQAVYLPRGSRPYAITTPWTSTPINPGFLSGGGRGGHSWTCFIAAVGSMTKSVDLLLDQPNPPVCFGSVVVTPDEGSGMRLSSALNAPLSTRLPAHQVWRIHSSPQNVAPCVCVSVSNLGEQEQTIRRSSVVRLIRVVSARRSPVTVGAVRPWSRRSEGASPVSDAQVHGGTGCQTPPPRRSASISETWGAHGG